MHMDAARFSPGRWVIVGGRYGAAARGALLRAMGPESGIGVGLRTTRARLRACVVNLPGPLRASMRICRPLARNLQVRATRPEARRGRQGERSSRPTACEAIELAALPPTSAVGGMPQGPSAWACDARDQRRTYMHGLRERAGDVTSPGTKPRPGCPQTHSVSALSSCCRRSAPRAAALSVSHPTQRRARRKASSIHVHVAAAGPPTSEACPRLLGIEECPHLQSVRTLS